MVQSSRKALLVATTRARFLLDLFLIATCISRVSSIVKIALETASGAGFACVFVKPLMAPRYPNYNQGGEG